MTSPITTRVYKGKSPDEAMQAFRVDIEPMAFAGLEPGAQTESKEPRRFLPDLYVLTVEWVPEQPWTGVRFYPNGNLRLNVGTADEARDAIKQVKQRKKELALEKRELTAQASAIRANNRGRTRSGPVANALAEIAKAKALVDAKQVELDRAMLMLEGHIAKAG